MSFKFGESDINLISGVLSAKPDDFGGSWAWHLKTEETKHALVLTVSNDVNLGDGAVGPLISVQTHYGYYELHNCIGYVIFEPDEIIFVHADATIISGLIVGKQCTCSTYSNISRQILSADFTSLDPAVLLSAMQLSLTEGILP